MKTAKCAENFLNQRLLNIKRDEILIRVIGDEKSIEINKSIFENAESEGLCRLAEYSGLLRVGDMEKCRRQYFTIQLNNSLED